MSEPKPHNPAGLSDEQIGVSEGWRLQTEKEHQEGYDASFATTLLEAWNGERWVAGKFYGVGIYRFRTKATEAELRAARGLPPETTSKPLADSLTEMESLLARCEKDRDGLKEQIAAIRREFEASLATAGQQRDFNWEQWKQSVEDWQTERDAKEAALEKAAKAEELFKIAVRDSTEDDTAIKKLAEGVGIQGDSEDGYYRDVVTVVEEIVGKLRVTNSALEACKAQFQEFGQRAEAADKEVEAMEAKLEALAPHGTCACSYDLPNDICAHHSPQVIALQQRLAECEKERDGWHKDACFLKMSLADAERKLATAQSFHDAQTQLTAHESKRADELQSALSASEQKVGVLGTALKKAYNLIVKHHDCAYTIAAGSFCPVCSPNSSDYSFNEAFSALAQLSETSKPEATSALKDVASERAKQIEQYSSAHDDEHKDMEIVKAAHLLLSWHISRGMKIFFDPWGLIKKHKNDPRQRLIVAAALIVAEIERLDRAATSKPKDGK